jgi:hypothetical protein
VTVSAQSLQIVWRIIPPVTVFVVYIKLTDVYWYEPTLLTFCAFMSSVWILVVNDIAFVNSLASISTRKRVVLISQLDLGGATNRARGSAFCLVMVS